jgi:hypothetical protein
VQFSQEEEEKITNAMGTMSEVQDALAKQLETLKYLTPQAAISSLTGDTADSLAILKQAYASTAFPQYVFVTLWPGTALSTLMVTASSRVMK